MNTRHPGFRRAAAVSWTLAGVGVAGVVGASLLAWADTVEKQTDSALPGWVQLPAVPPLSAPTTTTSMAPRSRCLRGNADRRMAGNRELQSGHAVELKARKRDIHLRLLEVEQNCVRIGQRLIDRVHHLELHVGGALRRSHEQARPDAVA